MFNVIKSISSDFNEGVRTLVLHNEVVASPEIDTELLGVTTHGDQCQITFVGELSPTESAALDAVVSFHVGVETLDAAKARVISDLEIDIRMYVERPENYPPHRQRSLLDLLIEARLEGLVNRASYVVQFKEWIFNEVMAYYYQKEAEIEACTTIDQVEAVTWDSEQFDSTNPHVTIAHTMSIEG